MGRSYFRCRPVVHADAGGTSALSLCSNALVDDDSNVDSDRHRALDCRT